MVTGRLRVVFVKIHLYIGLWLGLFFIMLGLTGAAIAWRDEIDVLLNPELLAASAETPLPVAPATVQAVTDKLQGDPRYGRPGLLMLPAAPHDVFVAWYPLKGPPSAGRSRQVMVDPVTLAVKGERVWGEPGLSRPLLMPTLFQLHHYLLSGETGRTILGIAGMLLLVMVIGGVVLWWPRFRLRAIVQAFRISHGGSWSRFNYSLHRAGGILVAPVLATIAFSGWYLNLPKWVTPLVASVATVTPPGKPVSAPAPAGTPQLGAAQAVSTAQALYPAALVTRVSFPRKAGDPFEVRVRQPGEVRQGSGATRIWLDAHTGRRLGARDPMDAPAGDTFLNWMYPLHTGEAFGLPGRIFISVFGLVPLLFAVTGVLIWWKRRSGHRRHVAKTLQRAGVREA
ncbi:PepSY-associated TM helix domain-containing protein [Cupriavidus basilensis]|uniref:PepSY-associated TM helix domain-containing protein n=1 Tax=Cupriavidus basilensis TaxID=68895 RepID=A0ABT6AIQ9_9BURK|nr:PepSY-associated TM helix domain-containing protein [Cupriavidus basilensis]MDF3832488.1 PepSY-associated TM helix domain-containing protein [Cupriavidus basilensis]